MRSPLFHRNAIWHAALVLLAALILAACASDPNIVNHSFGFDTRKDDQDAVVLDYRYGDSKLPVRAPERTVKEGKTFAFDAVHGPMRKADFLYVKWRNTTTGREYEDTVDLRTRLPADVTDHTVYFMIRGAQLYVYLIAPEKVEHSADSATNGPRMYRDRRIITIYPDRDKP
jgi:hypothetical protein